MTALDYITKKPLLPVITILKNDASVYTYNPHTGVYDFRLGQLTVRPAYDAVGGQFSMEIYGATAVNSEMNTILSNITEGTEVTIWVGKTDAGKVKIFLGIIEELVIDESNKNLMKCTISGPDWGSDLLKNRIVNYQVDQNRDKTTGQIDPADDSTSIINIVTDILNATKWYPNAAVDSITAASQGLVVSGANILPISYQLPTFGARYEFLDDKLQELDDYGLSTHYVDPDKNFIMRQIGFDTTPTATVLFTDDISDTTTWTSGSVGLIAPGSSFKRTLEHHKRRVFGLGGLSSTVDTNNLTTSSNDEIGGATNGYRAGRFIPTKTRLSNISLALSKIGTPTNDFVVELREDAASGTSKPTGQVLRSISKDKHFLDSTGTTATFTWFEMNEELIPGHNYWITCLKNGNAASNCFRWHRDALTTGVDSRSDDDIAWTTDLTGFNYAFQTYMGNELIAVSKDPNLVSTSRHFHEDTIRKSDIIDDAVLRFLLTQENKTAHKKKEILKCQVYAPDTLLTTGDKVRVRKQTSGYVVDSGTDGFGDFTLGQIEYVFESGDDQVTGAMYYQVELTRFVTYN